MNNCLKSSLCLIAALITGLSGGICDASPAEDQLISEMTGVWRLRDNKTVITLNYEIDKFSILINESFSPCTKESVDIANQSLTISCNAPKGNTEIFTFSKDRDTPKNSPPMLIFTASFGVGKLTFVRKITDADLKQIKRSELARLEKYPNPQSEKHSAASSSTKTLDGEYSISIEKTISTSEWTTYFRTVQVHTNYNENEWKTIKHENDGKAAQMLAYKKINPRIIIVNNKFRYQSYGTSECEIKSINTTDGVECKGLDANFTHLLTLRVERDGITLLNHDNPQLPTYYLNDHPPARVVAPKPVVNSTPVAPVRWCVQVIPANRCRASNLQQVDNSNFQFQIDCVGPSGHAGSSGVGFVNCNDGGASSNLYRAQCVRC